MKQPTGRFLNPPNSHHPRYLPPMSSDNEVVGFGEFLHNGGVEGVPMERMVDALCDRGVLYGLFSGRCR